VCVSTGTKAGCESALEAYGDLSFTCTKAEDDEECLKSVKDGNSDVTVVGGACL
jgi:hypothetical protein